MADTEAEGIVKPFGDMEPRERWLFALELLEGIVCGAVLGTFVATVIMAFV